VQIHSSENFLATTTSESVFIQKESQSLEICASPTSGHETDTETESLPSPVKSDEIVQSPVPKLDLKSDEEDENAVGQPLNCETGALLDESTRDELDKILAGNLSNGKSLGVNFC
jgi:hypothetical protein